MSNDDMWWQLISERLYSVQARDKIETLYDTFNKGGTGCYGNRSKQNISVAEAMFVVFLPKND